MSIIKETSATWDLGLYELSGQWYPWEGSCRTWASSTSWITCEDNMFLNTTTGLWSFWPSSQFYESTMEIWANWTGKWTKNWMYQFSCFQCPSNQYFNLETMACVSSWDYAMISVNSSQFNGIPIWKSLDIYVDPTSSSLIELGTKNNPYK